MVLRNTIMGKAFWDFDDRKQKGRNLVRSDKVKKMHSGWSVGSETHTSKKYIVKIIGDKPECNCEDCQASNYKCKHIHAVELYIKKERDPSGEIKETKELKVTYSQNWKAYDKTQTNEKFSFMKLLSDLVKNVKEKEYSFGRPKISLRDILFCISLKVYSTLSLRRFMSDLKIAKDYGYLDKIPCYSSIGHFMQKEELTPILKELIRITSTPLISVEEDFAVDSSGFATSGYTDWNHTRHGKDTKKRIWLKAHIVTGVKTNIITSCNVTDSNSNDSIHLTPLLNQMDPRFSIKEVSADKAYSSKKNLKDIHSLGAIPYIPFKKNVVERPGSGNIWFKMHHYFKYRNEHFMSHYHKRSNVEVTFYMVKAKYSENLRSKTKEAQINEILLKVLCHNICVVIQEMNELGISGEFLD
jgi:transposase